MFEELSKKDKLWRDIALKICGGDKSTADDVVNEMYLRRYYNDRGQQTTDYYILCTMKSIYLNMKKSNRLIAVGDIVTEKADDETFEPTDEQQELLDKAAKLPYTKRELLELNYDNSLRDIQEQFGINYVYVYRSLQEARKEILGENIHLYQNKRLKHKKMAKSKGLGDTIEKITKATGIKKLVELAANGKDCGCNKRKEALNKLWSYNYKPECLTEQQIKDYKNFVDNRTMKLTDNGKAEGRLSQKEVEFVTGLFAKVFNRKKWSPTCTGCIGTAKTLISMVYKLDTVFLNNINEHNLVIKEKDINNTKIEKDASTAKRPNQASKARGGDTSKRKA
jgi:DNA-directed RNA polymerase specialized sigma24 family protein